MILKNLFILFIGLSLLLSCKTTKILKEIAKQDAHFHMGVLISDTQSGKILFSQNAQRNFVPASNTKILTLYASLKNLADSIPAYKYFVKGDTTFVLGTGDPTLLHPDFPESPALKRLKAAKVLVISDQNLFQTPYASGWAWDDYQDYYQAELSSLPVYGNVVRISKSSDKLTIEPKYFKPAFKQTENNTTNISRSQIENVFYYDSLAPRKVGFSHEVPFKTDFKQTAAILSQVLGIPVISKHFEIEKPLIMAYSTPIDTVLRKMMQQSDNFLAEQLLLLSGGKFSDSISTEKSITHLKKQLLGDINLGYDWIDGSGLSRYNLFSPEIMVNVLNKLYNEFDRDRLFSMLSIGGKAGTLRRKYLADVPYVYAKTGSMSGVYNESGFLIAKSGRLLTYSVMKNNFSSTVSQNGGETMKFIEWVRSRF